MKSVFVLLTLGLLLVLEGLGRPCRALEMILTLPLMTVQTSSISSYPLALPKIVIVGLGKAAGSSSMTSPVEYDVLCQSLS